MASAVEYQKCDQGHTIYDGWCECQRTAPVGTETYALYDRETKSWCGLPPGQRTVH